MTKKQLHLVIVTGMSGAGRSSAMRILEDDGYFCVDNLPVSLLPTFMELTKNSSEQIEKVALGLDIRVGAEALRETASVLRSLKSKGYEFEILFFEASTPVLVKRYKETRRLHPLAKGGRIDSGIEAERELLIELKSSANYIIDTSTLLIRDLKQEIERIFEEDQSCNFYLTFVSFGFKYGIPTDSDLVFDVRFLPNPYYYEGSCAKGVGSQHTKPGYIWHIALAIQGLTSKTKEEKLAILNTMKNTDAGKHMMHEGFDVNDPANYTREWFSWANAMFCELVMQYCGYEIKK